MKSNIDTAIDENVFCQADYLGIIKVTGDDAQSFLQGQFSNDVALTSESHSQLNSYNSPKGRLYAIFRLFKSTDDYYLLLPKEILEPVIKRLRMFVMRSKVVLEDLSENWTTIGLSGSLVKSSISHFPGEVNGVIHENELTYIQIPGTEKRLLIIGPTDEITKLKSSIEQNFSEVDENFWKRLDIHAGFPSIYSSSQEEFVAQMVNLQLVDGVSFTKGCYPGQEVVARMHYLGKLKKRMYRVVIEGNSIPAPAENLYLANNDNTQSIGQIVDAQLNDSGGIDALAVLQTKVIGDESDIRVGSTDGTSIEIADLPYSFE